VLLTAICTYLAAAASEVVHLHEIPMMNIVAMAPGIRCITTV